MVNTMKLKGRMVELGLTQVVVADKLGMNPATLNKKLNNLSGKYLTLEEAENLRTILGISKSDISEYFFV